MLGAEGDPADEEAGAAPAAAGERLVQGDIFTSHEFGRPTPAREAWGAKRDDGDLIPDILIESLWLVP